MTNPKEKYLEFAESFSELISLEGRIHNKRRLVEDLKQELKSSDSDGACGIEFTAHAFKQISERLEELAMESTVIYKDVFNIKSPSDSLLVPSNLKSFVITLLANANNTGCYEPEESRSNKTSSGIQYKYTMNMTKWSGEKSLQFIAIIESGYIKTGFFNWVV